MLQTGENCHQRAHNETFLALELCDVFLQIPKSATIEIELVAEFNMRSARLADHCQDDDFVRSSC